MPESSSDGSLADAHGHRFTIDTTSRAPGNTKRKRTATQGTSGRSTSREYCTRKCLLGLQRRRVLDPACPNHHSHQRNPGSRFHELNVALFHQLVQAQLTTDMDCHRDPLDRQGARGALFKISLISHGYAFVGKRDGRTFCSRPAPRRKDVRCSSKCAGFGNTRLLRQHGPRQNSSSRWRRENRSHVVRGIGRRVFITRYIFCCASNPRA